MTDRAFLWGLSFGVIVFAVAGAFWLGLGIATTFRPSTPWWIWAAATLLQAGVSASLLIAALKLRRRSGFRPSEIFSGSVQEQAEFRRIRIGFIWPGLAEGLLMVAAVWWCEHTGSAARIWPSIGLVVSLHFVPLARLFHVRVYYAAAGLGAVASVSAILGTGGGATHIPIWYCPVMAATMWATAAYLVGKSGAITSRAIMEPWAI